MTIKHNYKTNRLRFLKSKIWRIIGQVSEVKQKKQFGSSVDETREAASIRHLCDGSYSHHSPRYIQSFEKGTKLESTWIGNSAQLLVQTPDMSGTSP